MNSALPLPNPDAASGLSRPLEQTAEVAATSRRWLKRLRQCLIMVGLGFASYFLVSHFLLQSVRVIGFSMLPTLQDSDRYLLNRWIFKIRAPRSEDIVVLRDPVDKGLSVKRVVGIPGDSITIRDETLYVNGRILVEPYLLPGTPTFAAENAKEQSFKCAPGEFFVLGDNRNSSVDSRVYGPVPRANILGLIVQ
jgi:signal peptidase I